MSSNIYGTSGDDKKTYSTQSVNVGDFIEKDKIDSLLSEIKLERKRRGKSDTGFTINDHILKSDFNHMIDLIDSKSLSHIDSSDNITALFINNIINKNKELGLTCLCDCNYCTCNCNYCTCDCNYCTCDCNYCTCDCQYCTCDCQYCTCDCQYCTCDCQYCTCDCQYCTCDCQYCTCDCQYCTCDCQYCTCDCQYCTCDCQYCTCDCNYCNCDCNYSCTCNCNYGAPVSYKSDKRLKTNIIYF